MTESWSLGWIIGGPIAIILLLLILAATIACFRLAFAEPGEYGFWMGAGITVGLIGMLLTAFFMTPWGFYPTGGSDYHKYKPKTGEVSEVGRRLLPSGEKSMEEKIVVRFKGSNQEYGVTDTRAALLKPGDTLVIKCKKSYDFGSVAGFDCKYVSATPKGSN
jgi:hypothetical protein